MPKTKHPVAETEQIFRGWDKGLDYPTERVRLEKLIADKITTLIDAAWYCIFLIQLENGSRIGEAVDTALEYADKTRKEFHIKAEKRRDGEKRLMIVPKVVFETKPVHAVFHMLNGKYKRQALINQGISRCRSMLDYNTHALRHCRLSYWIFVEKKSPAEVASMVKMTKMDTLMNYMQNKKGEEALRGAVT